MLTRNEIFALLHFWYIPPTNADWSSAIWMQAANNADSHWPDRRTESQLVAEGIDALGSAFCDAPQATHVVPISGGLDSRTVLAGLLDAGLRDHIVGVTFGVPGNLNYEIGALVAEAAGIKHISIDLSRIKLDTESLVKAAAKEKHRGWIFDFYYNRLIPQNFGADAVYWSGFMGDALAGRHLSSVTKPTWEEAIRRFIQSNKRVTQRTQSEFDPMTVLPRRPPVEDSPLGFDDQLDFGIRQRSYIRDTITVSGYDYRTPFLNRRWLEFILNVPRSYRYKERLYHKILLRAYPRLFSLPTRNTFGLSLGATRFSLLARRLSRKLQEITHRMGRACGGLDGVTSPTTHKYMTYIDFDEGFRQRKDLNELANENVADLARRDIITWVDIRKLWNEHKRGIRNHGSSISMLVSLEIILKYYTP